MKRELWFWPMSYWIKYISISKYWILAKGRLSQAICTFSFTILSCLNKICSISKIMIYIAEITGFMISNYNKKIYRRFHRLIHDSLSLLSSFLAIGEPILVSNTTYWKRISKPLNTDLRKPMGSGKKFHKNSHWQHGRGVQIRILLSINQYGAKITNQKNSYSKA